MDDHKLAGNGLLPRQEASDRVSPIAPSTAVASFVVRSSTRARTAESLGKA